VLREENFTNSSEKKKELEKDSKVKGNKINFYVWLPWYQKMDKTRILISLILHLMPNLSWYPWKWY